MYIKELSDEEEKLYYGIREVADMFKVNISLIRFWEKEFDVLKPAKNKKGNRLFTRQDLENLKLIFHLVKEKGYTLEGAKKILSTKKPVANRNLEIEERLLKVRGFLTSLKENL